MTTLTHGKIHICVETFLRYIHKWVFYGLRSEVKIKSNNVALIILSSFLLTRSLAYSLQLQLKKSPTGPKYPQIWWLNPQNGNTASLTRKF